MDRTQLTQARRELDTLEDDVAAFRLLNARRVRQVENRIHSVRITVLSKLAQGVAKQRQLDAHEHERELMRRAQISGSPNIFGDLSAATEVKVDL
jgi:hypothetical protein